MNSHPSAPSPTPPGEEPPWLPLAAFAFVVLALAAMAAIPAILVQRIARAAEEITTTILPANDALRDITLAMEERVTASRSRFLTGDPRYDSRLAAAKIRESEALRNLVEIAPRLGPSARQLESLREFMTRRDSLEASISRSGEDLAAYRTALPVFDALHDSMLVALGGFREDLVRLTEARVADEARWVGLQRLLSFVLGAVAVSAALLVGWFALRQRRLRQAIQSSLLEANRQKAIAERRESELQASTESRVRLLRGVTHDVKNPLGAARGYAELLEMGVKAPLHAEQAPLVKGVIRSVNAALAIIADLLDLARADTGGLTINRAEVDLNTVVTEAAEDHRPAAEAAGHALELCGSLPHLQLFTDPVRVRQVLGNLLSNAIKYTPSPGRVEVCSEIRNGHVTGANRTWVAILISDTGPGIPASERDAVFEEFTRLDDAGPQKGHGLGLAIARRISRLLGGELTVEDADGGGAKFVLWLPLRDDGDPLRSADGRAN